MPTRFVDSERNVALLSGASLVLANGRFVDWRRVKRFLTATPWQS